MARTAFSLKSSWRTTTQHCRTPSTKAGTWRLHVRADHGRRPARNNTREKLISWNAFQGDTCLLSISLLILSLISSTRGLNTATGLPSTKDLHTHKFIYTRTCTYRAKQQHTSLKLISCKVAWTIKLDLICVSSKETELGLFLSCNNNNDNKTIWDFSQISLIEKAARSHSLCK